MESEFKAFIRKCIEVIQGAYESSPTLDESEKLAALFLDAQIRVGTELKSADLDARMRKSGLKEIKAVVYLEAARATDRKPSDVMLAAIVDSDPNVQNCQKFLDEAEVNRNQLEGYYSTFREAHIFFRGMSRGRFE